MVSVSVLSNLYKIKYSVLNNTFQYLPQSVKKKQYLVKKKSKNYKKCRDKGMPR